jgi:hypothetical protein
VHCLFICFGKYSFGLGELLESRVLVSRASSRWPRYKAWSSFSASNPQSTTHKPAAISPPFSQEKLFS